MGAALFMKNKSKGKHNEEKGGGGGNNEKRF